MRRVLVLLGTLLLMMVGLSACGGDDGSGKPTENTGSVTVSGEFGKAPEVTFEGDYARVDTEATVLTEGKGDAVEMGDSVFANLYIANGYTGEKAASTWDEGSTTMLQLSDDTLPGIKRALDGQKVGSRVEVQATPEDAFGKNGNPQLAIAPDDPVVFVVDIERKLPDSIKTKNARTPKGAPKVIGKDSNVTALKFTGKQKKITDLETITLVKGKGPKAKKGDTMVVKYLGQVNGEKKPFDENYSKDSVLPVTIGGGGVIQGWQDGLTGVTEGSRVMLRVPSKLGYGKKGSGKKIPPNADLVFVIDVLAVN